ncbi:MAG: S8 family serine peptidase [Candidatus Uhrbacteria bacterium]
MGFRYVIFGLLIILMGCPLAALALVPSDPLFSEQWYLQDIGAPTAWDTTIGNPSSVIAVLDIGVDINHPDLADAMWINPDEVSGNGIDDDGNGYIDDMHGWDFVGHDADPTPAYDVPGSNPNDLHHGTTVAGIIAARGDNGVGIVGIDWLAKIMPLRVLSSDGTGDVSAVLKALAYAEREGATIVNMSFVGADRSPELDAMVDELAAHGILIVAAGGNEDNSGRGNLDVYPAYPICSGTDGEDVLGVAASDQNGQKASFSSYGSCVDIVAPGSHIAGALYHDPTHTIIAIDKNITKTTFSDPFGGYFSGTSYATPIVAGAASLLRGLLPLATPHEIVHILKQTAVPVERLPAGLQNRLGAGRLNLAAAVAEAAKRVQLIPSTSRSTIDVDAVLASPGVPVPVRVTVRDANGNGLAGRAVVLGSSRVNDSITPSEVLTDAGGVATFAILATEEGIATLAASAGDLVIANGRAVFASATTAPIGVGSLLKGSTSAVYVIGSDAKRYAFPDAQTYRSWYADDFSVQRVPDTVLAAFPLGGLITVRPGTYLVKIQSDPKVYAVDASRTGRIGGMLRWVESETVATQLFGSDWAQRVIDVPVEFFTTYTIGASLDGTTYPDGVVLEDERDGERYLAVNGTRRHIMSMLSFLQNGFQLRHVIHIPTVNLPDGAPIIKREANIAAPVL